MNITKERLQQIIVEEADRIKSEQEKAERLQRIIQEELHQILQEQRGMYDSPGGHPGLAPGAFGASAGPPAGPQNVEELPLMQSEPLQMPQNLGRFGPYFHDPVTGGSDEAARRDWMLSQPDGKALYGEYLASTGQ